MPSPQPGDVHSRPPVRRPFVGRETELAGLRAHLGRAGLVLVTGDPGIGKTRLTEEFVAEAETHGALAQWGRCWEGDGAPAFWPWIQILRALGSNTDLALRPEIERLLADLQGRLPDAADADALDPAPSRFRLFDAVTTVLVTVAAERPLVLVLEDLHWADTPSVVLLQFLVRHAKSTPLLVIATYRDAELDPAHALRPSLRNLLRHGDTVPLVGLGAEDVERYVAAMLGDERARMLAPRLHRETEGHPFFLVEMVRLLEASAAAALAGIPDGIRELIARRLRQRSPECHELLRVAAVVGRDFASPVLRRLPSLAGRNVVALIGEALDARLLVPSPTESDGWRFSHALVREALHADLPLADRVRLHREVGEAIEATADGAAEAAVLAHHFREAAAGGDAGRAIHWGIRAGERAAHALAFEEAIAHYERTVQLLERERPVDEARRCPLLIALGLAQVRAGDPTSAEATFHRAAAVARACVLPEELARAALGIGEIERHSERVVPLLEEALAALDGGDSVLRARLLSRLAVALYWARPEARKRALSDEAIAMARRLGYAPTLAYSLSSRIAALSGPDDVEERLAASREMVMLAEQCAPREFAMIGYGWSIADALTLGDVHQARFAIGAFAALAEEARHPYFDWWLAAIRTMEALLEGRLADAEELGTACFARGQRTVAVDATQVFTGHRYALCMETERHDELEPLVRAVVAQFPDIPGGQAGLALLHADRGRASEAVAVMDALAVDRFAALPRNPEWLTSIAVLAQTSALVPGAPHAATLFELLAPYRGRNIVAGMGVLCAGSVGHFLGILAARLGRFEVAEGCFAEALAAHERLGAVVLAAYTRYEQASLALTRRGPGDAARAAALAAEAGRTAEAHGMRRLQRLLASLPFADASTAEPSPPVATARTARFRREGDYWQVRWTGAEFRLRDRVGLHHLAALLAAPGRELLAVDLVRTYGGRRGGQEPVTPDARLLTADLGPPRTLTSAEPTLDARAERAYRERLRELQHVLADARRHNDLGRVAEAERETDALTREIARSLGLAGRARDSRSPIERARISATRAIRVAIGAIEEHDRGLGRHLAITVKTGTFCIYVPDPEVAVTWEL